MNENLVLQIISKVISNNFQDKFKILYRPHPYTEIKNFEFIKKIKNIQFDKTWKNFSNKSKQNNIKLLKSIDGVVTVMASTMLLEALHFSIPVLALSTNIENRGIYNWEVNHKNLLHLKCIFNKNFIVNSCSTNFLDKKCKLFLTKVLDNNFEKKNKKEIDKFLNQIISKSLYFETINKFVKN